MFKQVFNQRFRILFMPFFYRDPSKEAISVVAESRSKRPHGPRKHDCPFCVGNERATPPTTAQIPSKGKNWKVRSFRNKFPILEPVGSFRPIDRFFWMSRGFGEHEVIVESDRHEELFQNFSSKQLDRLFQAYCNRFKTLMSRNGIEYVILFRNHGEKSGASIPHEHAQIISLPFIPKLLEKEIRETSGKDFFDKLLEKQKSLLENKFFKAIIPEFGRFNYEVWIISKKHHRSMLEFSKQESSAFMKLLAQVTKKVYSITDSYNVVFHNSPKLGDMHFHVEIYPRTGHWSGLELGTGVYAKTVSAGTALKKLRKA